MKSPLVFFTNSFADVIREDLAWAVSLFESLLNSPTIGVWIRCAVVLAIAYFACRRLKSVFLKCTIGGVGLSVVVASVCAIEPLIAVMLVVAGPTLGAFIGSAIETHRAREQSVQRGIERRYARKYVCPECGHEFVSIQRVVQCPQCECPARRTPSSESSHEAQPVWCHATTRDGVRTPSDLNSPSLSGPPGG